MVFTASILPYRHIRGQGRVSTVNYRVHALLDEPGYRSLHVLLDEPGYHSLHVLLDEPGQMAAGPSLVFLFHFAEETLDVTWDLVTSSTLSPYRFTPRQKPRILLREPSPVFILFAPSPPAQIYLPHRNLILSLPSLPGFGIIASCKSNISLVSVPHACRGRKHPRLARRGSHSHAARHPLPRASWPHGLPNTSRWSGLS